jgi:hypothetical protein
MLRGVFDREASADDEHRLRFDRHRDARVTLSGRAGESDQEDDQEERPDEEGEYRADGGGEDRLEKFFHGADGVLPK